jgi:hypothetical protein
VSRLRLPNGDDPPDAAHKHLLDANALLASQRADGAAYLSGYVAECALKTLFVYETGRHLSGHDYQTLLSQINAVATIVGAKAARCFGPRARGVASSALGGWTPGMRYRAASMTQADASAWHAKAESIFRETVQQMQLDGVI